MNENRLLAVDASVEFLKLVETIALETGYSCEGIDDPGEFWRSVELFNPTLIVMDLAIPGTDGIEILREMGTRRLKCDVVIASGVDRRTLETARRLGKELGVNVTDVIEKPAPITVLRQTFESAKRKSNHIDVQRVCEALADDEMFLVYQPKIDIQSGSAFGVEALIRWAPDEDKIIYPDSFIGVVEQSGKSDELCNWVMAKGIAQAAEWYHDGYPLTVSLNLSAHDLLDRQRPQKIANLCEVHGLPPDRIVLELTETAFMRDAATMLEVLTRFRVKGFHLSIDDFGTGYSSLSQLLRLPFSEIKIDRKFITELETDHESAIIAKTIVSMGHNLGLSVVAEGVETEMARDELTKWGCDIGQGYWFSKPVLVDDIPGFVDRNGIVNAASA